MAGRFDDDDGGQPWHNRTSTVLGASVAAILVIGILIVAATALARQFGETEQAPIDFVTPSFSATASRSETSTTTQTITSTSPPETTDINAPSVTSSSETTSSSESSTRRPTTRRDDDEDEGPSTRTTRRTPRTNITRTFSPLP